MTNEETLKMIMDKKIELKNCPCCGAKMDGGKEDDLG